MKIYFDIGKYLTFFSVLDISTSHLTRIPANCIISPLMRRESASSNQRSGVGKTPTKQRLGVAAGGRAGPGGGVGVFGGRVSTAEERRSPNEVFRFDTRVRQQTTSAIATSCVQMTASSNLPLKWRAMVLRSLSSLLLINV